MAESLSYAAFTRMLRQAAELVKAHKELLSKLDSHGGDGDHGPTMARAMDKLIEAIESSAPGDFKALCNAIAWGIMGADGAFNRAPFGLPLHGYGGRRRR